MSVEGPHLKALIEGELKRLADDRIVGHIRSLLVEPHQVLRDWDYGQPGDQHPCWTVLDHSAQSETGIAYCEHGFGPECPWGLVFMGAELASMGMDSQWFPTFTEAYFNSMAATELPIWRVYAWEDDALERPLTSELPWEDAWEQCKRLRENAPQSDYAVAHPASRAA